VETQQLESAPSLESLYARAVIGPLVPGGGSELPDHRLALQDADVSADRVAAYSRVCGFRMGNSAPGTYPHVLAFPMHMSLMTERSFPFSVLGLVHIANRIEVLAPIELGSRLDLTVWAEDLRPHRRGRQFDLVTEAQVPGSTVWRGRSTYLRRGGESSDSAPPERDEEAAQPRDAVADWKVPGDIGRRYAAVSGDRNPIHMHPLAARLFGYPSAIAHGMWTKARCLAAFEGRVPETFAIEADFKSPLRIPGRARLRSGRRDNAWVFRLESPDGEHTHLVGTLADLAAPSSAA
jgi:acyl dehydratase